MGREIIGDFICCGEYMVIVKLENAAHVMQYDEWKSVYRRLHPERWEENGEREIKNRKVS